MLNTRCLGFHGQMTPGVKKIVLSQKTFANHLADEEAAIALREEEAASKPRPSASRTKRASLSQSNTVDVEMSDAPPQNEQSATRGAEDHLDEEPLLKINVPPAPTEEELKALLAIPPLSYNAARAAASTSTAPPRQFCEICGYWGRVRCMKCGVRVCGLDCQRQHDDSSCQKFWA